MTPAAFKDAWAIFLMASGSMSVCLYSCGNESKASLFFSGRLFRNSSIRSSRSMRAPCLLGVVASRGTGPWGTPQVFYAGEYDSSSISENHFRDNRCLEKVRCLGMFSHTIVENVKRRRVGRTGTERQNGRKAHVVMCSWHRNCGFTRHSRYAKTEVLIVRRCIRPYVITQSVTKLLGCLDGPSHGT